MVGVQRHRDGVGRSNLASEPRKGDCAGRPSLDGVPHEVVGTSRCHLNDAVRTSLGEPLQNGVQRLRTRDVDGRVGKAAGLGAVNHCGVLVGGGDGHQDSSWASTVALTTASSLIKPNEGR